MSDGPGTYRFPLTAVKLTAAVPSLATAGQGRLLRGALPPSLWAPSLTESPLPTPACGVRSASSS